MASFLPPLARIAGLSLLLTSAPTPAQALFAQPKNLKVLPKDISAEQLRNTMKGFSKGLRVRCDYCHTATDPNDLGSYDFAADDKPEKERARDMWRMVDVINTRLLVTESTPKPTLQVQCETCHRGLAKPELMTDWLMRKIDEDGIEHALTDYRALKNERLGDGSYDFSETPLLEAAMTLAARGNHVTEPLLSLAASLFPDSIRSFQTKARIHVLESRPEAAISALQQGYGRGADNDAQLDRQIDALRKAPSR